MNSSTSVSFKIFLQGDSSNTSVSNNNNAPKQVRRISVEKQPNWCEFRSLVYDLFGTEKLSAEQSSFTIEYEDDENDHVQVSTEQEWNEALRIFKAHNISPFKIHVHLNKKAIPQGDIISKELLGAWPRKKEFKCKEKKLNKIKKNKSCSIANAENQVESSTSNQEIKALKKQQKQLLKLKQQMDSSPFEDHPLLKVGALIQLQSFITKKNLRVQEDGSVDGNGINGRKAAFRVHGGLCDPSAIRLQNVANPNYWLKIGHDCQLDGKGHGGPWTELKVHVHKTPENDSVSESNLISLRSVKMEGKAGVGILENGQIKPAAETGLGNFGKFLVLPYVLKQKKQKN